MKTIKSVLGMGNALVDILATTPNDDLLKFYSLPKGSMQHVDERTADGIYENLKQFSPSMVAGGSAANTAAGIARLGLPAGFLGKTGNDELGRFYLDGLEAEGVKSLLLNADKGTGRAAVLISPDSERTFAVYLGAALDLTPEDVNPEMFDNYDCLHIEGYLIQDHKLIEKAVCAAKETGRVISLDLASYNVVDENLDFLAKIVEKYADIVFANEEEAKSFTGKEPREALDVIAEMCDIAVVKIGARGAFVKHSGGVCHVPATSSSPTDLTGAGDLFASGFLYGLSRGDGMETCAKIGTVCAGEIIKVIGTKLPSDAWNGIRRTIDNL